MPFSKSSSFDAGYEDVLALTGPDGLYSIRVPDCVLRLDDKYQQGPLLKDFESLLS